VCVRIQTCILTTQAYCVVNSVI